MPRRIRETAVEITFFQIQNALLPKGYVLGEKVMEIVGLQSEPNTTSIGEPGGDEQVEEKPSKTFGLWRRR